MNRRAPSGLSRARSRRGVEAIEFAMILPLFFAMLFATVEFAWYMFQRAGVTDAARVACRTIAQMDPRFDDVVAMGAAVALDELNDALLDCDDGRTTCEVNIEDHMNEFPPRVICDVTVDFHPITGFLGQSDSSGAAGQTHVGGWRFSGTGMLPDTLRGRSVAVYESIQ